MVHSPSLHPEGESIFCLSQHRHWHQRRPHVYREHTPRMTQWRRVGLSRRVTSCSNMIFMSLNSYPISIQFFSDSILPHWDWIQWNRSIRQLPLMIYVFVVSQHRSMLWAFILPGIVPSSMWMWYANDTRHTIRIVSSSIITRSASETVRGKLVTNWSHREKKHSRKCNIVRNRRSIQWTKVATSKILFIYLTFIFIWRANVVVVVVVDVLRPFWDGCCCFVEWFRQTEQLKNFGR